MSSLPKPKNCFEKGSWGYEITNDAYKEYEVYVKSLESKIAELKGELEKEKQEKEDIRASLRELAYDVFFKEDNFMADVFWHTDYCTSFDNVFEELQVESEICCPEDVKKELEKLARQRQRERK